MSDEYNHYVDASVTTIARGELLKQIDYKLQEAIANSLDPNTNAKATRTVTIKLVVKPDETRQSAIVEYAVEIKLPCDAAGVDQLFIRPRDGRGFVPKGEQLNFDAPSSAKISVVDRDNFNG